MKKTAIIWLSVMFSIFFFAACAKQEAENSNIPNSTQESQEETDSNSSDSIQDAQEEAFAFRVNGISIPMDGESADLVDQLGDYDYFEAPSCAFQGLDKIYTYHGFTLYTYEADGTDHVLSVVLTDDSLTTPEGIAIGFGADEVTAAYGDDFTVNGSAYVYTKGKTTLSFILEDDRVISIEYSAPTAGQ